jgi:uncharacterized protein YdhG (YjbR/CyaY superfamily)
MTIEAKSPEEYISKVPEDRKEAMSKLRQTILKNLSKGFSECMSYNMISYCVPHSVYPAGYHCDPKQPLPFMAIASQKNFIAVYHMGMYAKKELLDWFTKEYPKHTSKKLDMGKSCLRFKKVDNIPYKLIGELTKKMSSAEWIKIYETNIKR